MSLLHFFGLSSLQSCGKYRQFAVKLVLTMESGTYHEQPIMDPKRPGKRVPEEPKPAEAKPAGKEDDFEEWEEAAKEIRHGAEKAVDAKSFSASEEAWFAEGDKPYSEEPPKLKEGEGFTEQDKKWFAEGERPWEGEDDGQPPVQADGAARR